MSGTLYRSPSLIIDDHEWHIAVTVGSAGSRQRTPGRAVKQYFWRPLSLRQYKWLSITAWKGPKPKGLWHLFQIYHPHANRAMGTDLLRRAAIERLACKRPNGAALRNVGTLREERAA